MRSGTGPLGSSNLVVASAPSDALVAPLLAPDRRKALQERIEVRVSSRRRVHRCSERELDEVVLHPADLDE